MSDEVVMITLRYSTGAPEVHIVQGTVRHIQERLDKAVQGNGRVRLTDARTGKLLLLELSDVETYSVKPGAR